MMRWTTAELPSLHGKTVVVTGTEGLAFETARALACAGAHVIIAGRNPRKGSAAVVRIRQRVPDGEARFEQLDLASLRSIAHFAERLRVSTDRLELLINNAAIMCPPERLETADGFELQWGTNYLGHFALTALLLPLLRKGKEARVVTLSSIAARGGAIDFDDLQSRQHYSPMGAYSQSKLACLMFALELQRRSDAAGWGVRSVAAHPGIARTNLLPSGAGPWSAGGLVRRMLWFLFQPVAQGALPTLFAATAPLAQGGAYYGPHAFRETRGSPALAQIPPRARDLRDGVRLWLASEKQSGIVF
jgi:NAD(P)-dependent dehydrogenase (short-subunit alcohol dehydrogenase family)